YSSNIYLVLIPPSTVSDTTLFFFTSMSRTPILTLSLHDALPIFHGRTRAQPRGARGPAHHLRVQQRGDDRAAARRRHGLDVRSRSEEHTSELQSLTNLVCRLLLEKKKSIMQPTAPTVSS